MNTRQQLKELLRRDKLLVAPGCFDGLSARLGLMDACAVFFVGCALIAVPSILLFLMVGRGASRAALTVNPT